MQHFKKFAFALCCILCVAVPASAETVSGTLTAIVGATLKTVLKSTSATTCTAIETNSSGRLVSILDASGAGQSGTLSVYDEAASPTCASADLIYTVTLLAGQITTLEIPLTNGLAYKLSAAATDNIIITRI